MIETLLSIQDKLRLPCIVRLTIKGVGLGVIGILPGTFDKQHQALVQTSVRVLGPACDV